MRIFVPKIAEFEGSITKYGMEILELCIVSSKEQICLEILRLISQGYNASYAITSAGIPSVLCTKSV